MGAPDIILRILARLQWAGQTAAQATGAYINRLLEKGTIRVGDDTPVNIEWENFNELLALGYMEKDEISVSTASITLNQILTSDGSIMMMVRSSLGRPLPHCLLVPQQ